jgi:predicted small lipoprotein YifL
MTRLPTSSLALLLAVAGALALAGCGASGEVYVEDIGVVAPHGDIEVDNQTDLTGSWETMYAFEVAPAATPWWSGNLLPDLVFPGEVLYLGSFVEDFYDAEAELDFGIVSFFDVFVEGGFTTTFQVF